ncbi:MAG: 4-alpha-glucanotransferase, partial [Acidimicrobiia bacterium]|nr:4-alpha-glucanotransferase [Acidimicrobiia bacterium]
ARWSTMAERHGSDWQKWPAALRDPNQLMSLALSAEDERRVSFHAWLQWLIERQLEPTTSQVALVQDLPIGIDPAGFDGWEWQDLLALDVSVGAPPDEFSRQGQDWGLPPFVPWKLQAADYQPFIDTIAATMAAGGGLRIDHVMGLFRLWWIARGTPVADGAFVRYNADDLLAIVALESHRAGAFVVGEDLGTVEDATRDALAAHDILSYRLLWFEEAHPTQWPAKAMAAVSTHDLPTVAGLWNGSDLESQHRLGLEPNEDGLQEIRSRVATAARIDEDADDHAAVLASYDLLAHAPSVLLVATLDDAVAEPERPNIPGADGLRPNWALALPATLEMIESNPLAQHIAGRLNAAVSPAPSNDPTTNEPSTDQPSTTVTTTTKEPQHR